MAYTVEITKRAGKELQKLSTDVQAAFAEAVRSLADDPRPNGVTKLKGYKNAYRIVVSQDYRVVYEIEDKVLKITLIRVAHRKEVYRDL